MDMDGFGSRVLKRSTYLTYIYREPVMFTGFKLFYKMTIGIIQKCTLLKSCAIHTKTKLHSISIIYRLMKNYFACLFLGFLLWQAVNPNQKNQDPQQIPLENKVVNKIIAPKVTNDAATILSKREVPILCYHNIKDFDASAGPMTKVYTVKPTDFAAQMKALSEAGYHTILHNCTTIYYMTARCLQNQS
jgi:hypothetical protein